jgi:hypothetical protein
MGKRTRKCRYCGRRFQLKGRGRKPIYCRPSHRVRAFEKRRFAKLRSQTQPLRLLLKDMQAILQEQRARNLILKVLRDEFPSLFPTPPIPPPKPKLHLVKRPSDR